jgi:hypothetical protein
MRWIQHHAVELRDARFAAPESGNDTSCPLTLRVGWRETGVDDLDLRRMDGGLGGEAVASGGIGLACQCRAVAKVGEHRVGRRRAGGKRGQTVRCDGRRRRDWP